MTYVVFFFKQKTAYEMRISDWSSDVCSSDLLFISCLIMGGTAAQASQYLQCVTYARQISGVQLSGNANTWWDHAEGVYDRGNEPRVGAVLAFRSSRAIDRKSVV